MFKFLMKSAALTTLVAGTTFAAFGSDTVMNWLRSSKEKVQEQISELQGMNAELNKVRDRVNELDQEVLELKESALKEQMEVENLEQQVHERQQTLDHLRRNLEKANTLLSQPGDHFSIQGITYTRREIEHDVAEKMRMFEVQQDTMAQLSQTMNTRKNALQLKQENVTRSKTLRHELMAQVQLLTAQVERYKARQVYAEAMTSEFDAQEFNTAIGETRQMLAAFEKKLAVKNRMLDDQIRIAVDGSHVAGIDYNAENKPQYNNIQEELSALLIENRAPTSGAYANASER